MLCTFRASEHEKRKAFLISLWTMYTYYCPLLGIESYCLTNGRRMYVWHHFCYFPIRPMWKLRSLKQRKGILMSEWKYELWEMMSYHGEYWTAVIYCAHSFPPYVWVHPNPLVCPEMARHTDVTSHTATGDSSSLVLKLTLTALTWQPMSSDITLAYTTVFWFVIDMLNLTYRHFNDSTAVLLGLKMFLKLQTGLCIHDCWFFSTSPQMIGSEVGVQNHVDSVSDWTVLLLSTSSIFIRARV